MGGGRKQKSSKKLLFITLIFFFSLISLVYATEWLTSTQSDFNEGNYFQTFYNTSGFVQLNATYTSGTYTSKIFDAGADTQWNNISWTPGGYYQQELPNNKGIENGLGGANMTGNVLLMHMNEQPVVADVKSTNGGFAFNGANTQADSGGPSLGREGSFDGTDDYVIAPHNNIPTGNAPRSISVWIKPSLPASDYDAVVSLGTKASTPNHLFEVLVKSDGTIYLHDWGSLSPSLGTVTANTWHHIVITFDGTTAKGYLDGSQTMTWTKTFNTDISDVLIGRSMHNFPTNYRNFAGAIDEVAIYNKTLSSEDVSNLYNSGNGYSHTGNENGLVSAWHLNENTWSQGYTTIEDTSGEGNNGTSAGTIAYGVDGKFNTAIGFDGVDDYIDCGNDASLDITDTITIEVWVKASSDSGIATGSRARIVNKFQAPAKGYILDIADDSGVEAFRVGISGTYVKSPNALSTSWTHVVAVYDGSNVILYENGTAVGSTAKTGAITLANANLVLGKDSLSSHYYFNGLIDEVAIYNRSLSAEEILDHYKRGALRLNLTVRSCDDANCSGESWTDVNDTSPQELSVTNNQYFQYKYEFETDDSSYTPELYNVTVDYTVLNAAPNVTLNAPENNSYISVDYSLLNATVYDSNLDNMTVWFYGNGSLLTTFYNQTNGTILTYNWTSLSEGLYNWTVIANDGTVNSTNEYYYFTVDLTNPSLTVSYPVNGTTYKLHPYETTLDLNYTATDPNLDSCWFTNITGQNETLANCNNGTINIPDQINDNNYNITVYVNDSAGNLNSSQIFFTTDYSQGYPNNTQINMSGAEKVATWFDISTSSVCAGDWCENVSVTLIYDSDNCQLANGYQASYVKGDYNETDTVTQNWVARCNVVGAYTFTVNYTAQNGSFDSTNATISISETYAKTVYEQTALGDYYSRGDNMTIAVTLEDSDGNPVTNDNVYVDIFYPNLTQWIDNLQLTEIASGLYAAKQTIPSDAPYGDYAVYYIGNNFVAARVFRVTKTEEYLEDIYDIVDYINTTITNTIIPYLQEINSTTHNSYDYLQNTIYPKVNDANSTIYDVLDKWGTYNATVLYDKINDANSTIHDVYTETQALIGKWGTYTAEQLYNISNLTYQQTIDIYNDMTTASALQDVQNNVTWLINNVATQENITLLSQKLDTINSTINTIKTQTDCSNESLNNASNPNYALCSYLYNINSTINTIYSEMATQENISAILSDTEWLINNVATQENMTEIISKLESINDTVNSIGSNLTSINASLQTKLDNIQDDVTWLVNNVATQENMTEVITRLTEINSTVNEIDNYLDNDITNRLTEINTTTQNNYDYLQNTVYIKLNETYNNTQQTLIYIGNPADDENQNTLFGEHAYTQNRLSSILGNLTYLKTLTEQVNITTEAINSTVSTILLEVDDLEELHQCSTNPNSTICTLLNNIKTDTQNIYTLSVAINETTQDINQTISSDFHVRLSDFGEVAAGSDFLLKVWIDDYLQQPKDADSNPTVMLYDPVRNAIGPFTMTKEETGIYSFNYTTTSSMTDGTWEAVVTTVVNGITNKYSDYWELESSPAEVTINSISDKTIPTITADVTITNEGTGAQEYQYEYCIVSSQDNLCGGDDDECYGSGAKLIQPGQSWNTQLTCDEITQTGEYWFKVLVYYGTEVSGASKSFTAVEAPAEKPSAPGSAGISPAEKEITTTTTNITPEEKSEEKVEEKIGRARILDYPGFIELKLNETIAKNIIVKNVGDGTLHNVKLTISGLPSYLYLINPKTVDIEPGETATFTVRFKPSLEEKQYSIKFIVSSDEDRKEEPSVLVISKKPVKKPVIPSIEVEPQTSILIGIIVAVLAMLGFVLIRERKLKEELEKIKKGVLAKRTEEEIKEEILKVKKHLQNLENMYKDEDIDKKSYEKSKEKLNKKLEKLKKELKEKEERKQGINRKKIKKERNKLKYELNKLTKAYNDGVIDKEGYEKTKTKLENKIKELELKLKD